MACRTMAIHGIYLLYVVLIHFTVATLQSHSPYSILFTNKRNDKNSDKVLVHENRAYVGGTNFFLTLTFTSGGALDQDNRVPFESTRSNQEKCRQFSPDDHCENTVRVIELMQDGTVLLCGTNSIGPKCSYYDATNGTFRDANLDANRWLTKSPTGSTTSLYIGNNDTDSFLYLGSVRNEAKTGVFTRRLPHSLKTDKSWLDAPEFLGTYALGRDREKVYTFFNEKSTKFVADGFSATNRKNNYYSMVARVCKNDGGGSWYRDMWMTFTKARLLCPWSGEDLENSANLYYNELVATFSTDDWVYGIFMTTRNWNLTSYALCKFRADDIDAVMEGRHYADNQTRFFNSKASGNAATFTAEGEAFVPGKCPASSNYELKSNFEQFVLENTLVKMNVLPEGRKAFFVGSNDETFKFILAEIFPWCTVIYLLTGSGTMAKLKVAEDSSVEMLFKKKLSPTDLGIKSANLMEKYGFILATTDSEVISLPVQSCSTYQDCYSCNRDPHCHWHELKDKPFFACRVANAAKRRTCAASPEKPHSLVTKTTREENVQITWKHAATSSLVFLRTKKEKDVVLSRKLHKSQITVDKSFLEDGRAYEVVVQSVNKTSLSAEISANFSTSLQSPRLSHHVGDGFVEMKWSQVPGAARYHMKLQNSSKGILQEFNFSAKQDNMYFYLSHLTPSKPYTVTVTATSEDGVESVGVRDFSGPAKKSEPLQQTSEATSSCGAFISALIVCVALFLGALLIILHNNCIIRPNISVLRNDDGCSYKRHHLLIWSRESKRKTQIKCDDTVVSSTSA